jgi:hypothetical protein
MAKVVMLYVSLAMLMSSVLTVNFFVFPSLISLSRYKVKFLDISISFSIPGQHKSRIYLEIDDPLTGKME